MRNSTRQSRPQVEMPSNVTPPWLLPFWRLVKGRAMGDFARAWRLLPDHLPAEMTPPTMQQLATALVAHQLEDR